MLRASPNEIALKTNTRGSCTTNGADWYPTTFKPHSSPASKVTHQKQEAIRSLLIEVRTGPLRIHLRPLTTRIGWFGLRRR